MDELKNVGMLLDELYQKLGRHYASLSRPQRRFLHDIEASSGIGVTALSNNLEITVAGATRMLDKLESEGLIKRCRQKSDARQVQVYITETGREVLAQADEAYLLRLGELLSRLSSREVEDLHSILVKIRLGDARE